MLGGEHSATRAATEAAPSRPSDEFDGEKVIECVVGLTPSPKIITTDWLVLQDLGLSERHARLFFVWVVFQKHCGLIQKTCGLGIQ